MKASMRMRWVAVAAATLALAACGGGGGSTDPVDPGITTVKFMGDSLADVGTFGVKYTVQTSASTLTGPKSTPLFSDHVAGKYKVSLCNYYTSTGTTFSTNTNCTGYAVAGGRINNFTNPTSPVSVVQQLKDAGAIGYKSSDLVVVDGGANDAGDLFGAYIAASKDGGKSFFALLGTQLDAATLQALQAQGAVGMPTAGGAYMKALAVYFAKNIQANTTAKGASRVAVMNMPGVTRTPKFLMVLGSVSQAQGPAAAAQLDALFDGWVKVFNAQLAESLKGDEKRLVIVDFYESFRDQAANPAQYSYTNVKTPVCPATGVDASGLPTYTIGACTADALSAKPPAGAGADWWKSYGFADSFHPSPYGHQLLSQLVSRSLAQAGWL